MSTDPQLRAKIEQERRRRARKRHNATWGRLARNCVEEERDDFVEILRGGWDAIKSDPMRVIPAVWLAESIRRLTVPEFRSKAPQVERWKYNDGTPRIGQDLLRGFDEHVVQQGFSCGIYDWGNSLGLRGPSAADMEALAAEGDMRARAAIDWVRFQMNPEKS